MINYVGDPSAPEWEGYFYAAVMFIAAVVQSLLNHQYYHRSFITGMRVRAAVIGAVYKKVCTSLLIIFPHPALVHREINGIN